LSEGIGGGGLMRDRSLRALEVCLERVQQSADFASVLDPRMLKHAHRVAARAAEGPLDLEVLHTLGWFHTFRRRASGEAFGEDFETAVAAHAMCLIHGVGPPPEELLPAIVESAFELGEQLLEAVADDESGRLLDSAVDAWRRILGHASVGEWTESFGCLYLALALEQRFSLTGRSSDLDELIEVGRRALNVMDDDHPSLAQALGSLRRALDTRLQRKENAADLDAVIEVSRRAAAILPSGHSDLAATLSGLSGALRTRFAQTRTGSDLDEAIAVMRRLTGLDEALPGMSLAALSGLHLERYLHAQDEADLDAAIVTGRQAAGALTPGHPLYGQVIAGRAIALDLRFGRRGGFSHLDELIEVGREALRTGHLDDVQRLARLAMALSIRAGQTGSSDDLGEAITVARQAVSRAEPGGPGQGLALFALSDALHDRFGRTFDLADLDEVIALRRQSVAALSVGDSIRAMALSSLSLELEQLSAWTDDPAALDEAIVSAREAVATMPSADRLGVAATHSNLGALLQERFKRSGDPVDLDEAVAAGQRAVTLTPVDFPARASVVVELCEGLRSRSRLTGDDGDLSRARDQLAEAASTSNGLTSQMVLVRRLQGVCALMAGDAAEALTWFEQAVDLLPMLVPGSLTRSDREHRQGIMGELGAEAATVAVAAGRPDRALELLEQTRGIFASEVRGVDDAAELLRVQAPDLLPQFMGLRADRERLDRRPAGAEPNSLMGPPDSEHSRLRTDRVRWMAEWSELIERVRARPGLEGFLRPLTVAELRPAAAEGPVVTVSVTDFGGMALVLTDEVRAIPLDGLTKEEALSQSHRLAVAADVLTSETANDEATFQARSDLRDVLDWLWRAVSEPILSALEASGQLRPRIWWCPVGVMTRLPLHAAGAAMDRVRSSYIPTVRALSRVRAAPAPGRGTLAVAMSTTPGAGPLPDAAAEVRKIASLIADTQQLANEQATREGVLARLPHCAVAHFACHAVAGGWSDPSGSRLLLHDHRVAPLTVADISRLRLAGSGLAYLSACATSVTSPRLQDEAVHLTGAFLLAGFQQVIGSLWAVNDAVSANVAHTVYRSLTRDGTVRPRTSGAAEALHAAVRRIRNRFPDRPELWAAYVHVGR
jgi:tetratricopeptide (TPR) repeat protein